MFLINNNIIIYNFFFNFILFKLVNNIKKNMLIYFSKNKLTLEDNYNFLYYSKINYNFLSLKKFIKDTSFWHNYFWLKITFRGKGYRVRKFFKSKKITFNFGRSHWTKLYLNNMFILIKKIRRQNYILSTLYKFDFYKIMSTIRYIKFINWYTQRGLRIKKQKIKKRFGKISQMVSSLHF